MRFQLLVLSFLVLLPISILAQTNEIFDFVVANDIDKVKTLIENTPSLVSSKDIDGRTPLHLAARGVHFEIMEYLIQKGADVNAKDNNQIYPIVSVTVRNHPQALKLLIDNGAKTDVTDNEGNYIIHIAARYGFIEEIKILLENGSYLEIKDSYQRTPLIVASREGGDFETIKYLIEKGADINAVDKYGYTPISLAAWRGYENIVNLLLDKNAVITSSGKEGRKLLQYACDKNLFRLYAKITLEGGDIFSLNSNFQTPMHWASIGGAEKIIKDLMKKGLPVNSKDIYGWTPLHYACYFGRDSVVEMLIENGAGLDEKTPLNETPLYLAHLKENQNITDILTSKGAKQDTIEPLDFTGEYFGQKKPENKPEVFAPGIVSRLKGGHSNITFSPDGSMAFWTEWNLTETGYSNGSKLLFSKIRNHKWMLPQIVLSRGDCPFFSVDGTRIYFRASISATDEESPRDGIWYFEIEDTTFSKPKYLDFDVENYSLYWHFSFDRYGNLYFSGSNGLSRSVLKDGVYLEPERLCEIFNPAYIGDSPYIAPDGNYIIFSSGDMPDSNGAGDLYIGFKTKEGIWSIPINLGSDINTSATEILPIVSSDGKYLFYRSDFGNIMWVNTSILNKLKPE